MWIYIVVCVGLSCPWGTEPGPHLPGGFESVQQCKEMAELHIEVLRLRYGLRDKIFDYACSLRGLGDGDPA